MFSVRAVAIANYAEIARHLGFDPYGHAAAQRDQYVCLTDREMKLSARKVAELPEPRPKPRAAVRNPKSPSAAIVRRTSVVFDRRLLSGLPAVRLDLQSARG